MSLGALATPSLDAWRRFSQDRRGGQPTAQTIYAEGANMTARMETARMETARMETARMET